MPKSYVHTARGRIERYFRNEGKGQPFNFAELAIRFKTSTANISALLADLRVNGWTINQNLRKRSTDKITYTPYPPGEKP